MLPQSDSLRTVLIVLFRHTHIILITKEKNTEFVLPSVRSTVATFFIFKEQRIFIASHKIT